LKKKREQGYPYIGHHILYQQSKTYFLHPSIIISSLLSSINNSLHSSICFSNQPCFHLSTTRCIHLSASAANLALIYQQLVAFIYLHQQPTLISSINNNPSITITHCNHHEKPTIRNTPLCCIHLSASKQKSSETKQLSSNHHKFADYVQIHIQNHRFRNNVGGGGHNNVGKTFESLVGK